MKNSKSLIGYILFLMIVSCNNKKNSAQNSIQISTDSEVPGEIIYIKYTISEKINNPELQVFFDSSQALVIHSNPDSTLEVMVPKLSAGSKTVSLKLKDKTIAKTGFMVEPAPGLKLILDYYNGKFNLLQKMVEYDMGNYEKKAGDRMMLFDLMDSSGKKIAGGAFENPGSGGHEVFGKPGQIHREKAMAGMHEQVIITIPNVKGKLDLKFFEIEQPIRGLTYDSLQKDNRILQTKKQIDQITIEN